MSVGFLGTLMARLTAARADFLDNLHLKLSTNMPNKSYYTDARGGKLDHLDEDISTRASASALAATDVVCDAIRSKTDSYLDSSVAGVRTVVDAIQNKEQYSQSFSSSGTWTRPSTVDFIDIKICGGGCAGKNNGPSDGQGGGGGAVVVCRVAVAGNMNVTIGAGSTSSSISGGDSSVAGTNVSVIAQGGRSLSGGVSQGGGDNNAVCCKGGNGGVAGSAGGPCYGWNTGGAAGGTVGGGGGGSWGAGGNGGDGANGSAGTKGGGGGGTYSSFTPGAGGDGFCAITWEV